MPKPHFILCCQNMSEDIRTGLLSLFHLSESITAIEKEPESGMMLPPELFFFLVIVWIKEKNEDVSVEYEQEIAITPSGSDEEKVIHNGKFFFLTEKWLSRSVLRMALPVPINSGLFKAVARIRPTGTGGPWIAQETCIVVDFVPLDRTGKKSGEPETGSKGQVDMALA